MIVAGTLLSVAAVFSQQAGPTPESENVVPKDALDAAVYRALNSQPPHFNPPPIVSGQKPAFFLTGPNVCAIPLIKVPVKPTHDRISRRKLSPSVDPKMVVAPKVPACPTDTH